MRHLRLCLLAGFLCSLVQVYAEPCITQSQIVAAERETLVRVATGLAALTTAGNAEAVRAQTMPQYAREFAGIQDAIRTAGPHLQGASFVPDTLWILDATAAKPGPDGSAQDVQFFCALNRSASQASFLIPALPAGRYALVVLNTAGTAEPWQIAMLLRQVRVGRGSLADYFPERPWPEDTTGCGTGALPGTSRQRSRAGMLSSTTWKQSNC